MSLLLKINKGKLKTLDFICKTHFEEDGTQNYLVFEQIKRYFKIIANTKYIYHGNLKDYLTKLLNLMPPLIIVLLHCTLHL